MSLPDSARTWRSRLRCALGGRVPLPSASGFGEWCGGLVSVPEGWEATHRLLVAVAIASAAFALGTYGWQALGLGSEDTHGVALAELQRRVDDARSKAGALPALRQAVQALHAPAAQADASSAQAWQSVAAVATRSGMDLQSVEPGEHKGTGFEAARVVRIKAKSSFASFRAFARELSMLPVLAVPAELKLEREANGLVLQAALELYDTLPGAPVPAAGSTADDARAEFGDPFALAQTAVPGPASALRLAGLMIEGARSLALIETDGQGAIYLPGQMLGNERLVRIGPASVRLAHGTGTRVLMIGADS